MRRRYFKVSLLVGKDEKIGDIREALRDQLSSNPTDEKRKPKVTYIRQRPWWRFWR